MKRVGHILDNQAARLIALAVIVTFYFMAQLPTLSSEERAELAARFSFERLPLPEPSGYTYRTVRQVSPALEHISAWISSVGAAVALNDLDGDGLANDVCWVDVRIDRVMVAPVPGSPVRYEPLVLDPATLPYDDATMAPMGCVPGDMNEDGAVDILVYYWGRTPIAFLRQGNGYVPTEVYPQQERWFTNAATMADVDGDGHVDLVIGNYFPDGAHVLDATSGDAEQMQHSMSRARNAGVNRILLWSRTEPGEVPAVEYREATGALSNEVAHGWTLAVGAADLDGDLLPEIYFANDFGPDRLLHNQSRPGNVQFALLEGERTLDTPSSLRLGKDSFKGMGTDFVDVNSDGLLDIYVSNIAAEYALEESHFLFLNTGDTGSMSAGVAPFRNASEPLGLSRSDWGWDSRLADFDNDGVVEAVQATGFVRGDVDRWPELQELAMGNDELLKAPASWPRFQPGDDLSGNAHNPFFVQDADGRYVDLADDIGIGTPMVTRGIATADVDGDGDLDFAVGNQWSTSYFYHNTGREHGSFLGLNLLLPVKPRDSWTTIVKGGLPSEDVHGRAAVGAQVRVSCPDGSTLIGLVDGGNGHSGCRSHQVHFGLGAAGADEVLSVELNWRDESGHRCRETVHLTPGWYTIILGTATTGEV